MNALVGVLYINLLASLLLLQQGTVGELYTYIGVGLSRCSFRLTGQCESLYSVERVTRLAPRFLCIWLTLNYVQPTRSHWPMGFQMAKILFVVHPYTKPKYMKGNLCLWNITNTHWRKQILAKDAKYICWRDKTVQTGDISFIGEWECCSNYRSINSPSNHIFDTLHEPFITAWDNHPMVLNTDPFVFGSEFYYSCCKIEKTKNMQPGDIVLFGSYSENQILLDTVLVLAEKVEPMKQSNHRLPWVFYHVTLSKNDPEKEIWVGNMYNNKDQFNGMFSFVPCSTSCNKLPCIINNKFGKYKIPMAQNTNPINIDDKDLKNVFDEIINRVFSSGLCLGINIPIPQKGTNLNGNNIKQQAIIQKISNKGRSRKSFIE